MRVGFIGTGNMGSAIIKGIITSGFLESDKINVYDIDEDKIKELGDLYKVKNEKSEKDVVKNSDIIILCVKPNIILQLLEEIKEFITEEKIILSIAAGISIENMEDIIGVKKIVRTMPNTPAQIQSGMTAVSFNDKISEKDKNIVFSILNSFGKSIEIEEKLMHVYTAISGSLPAYVYLFIESLADGAVLEGMNRQKAYEIISESIIGSAKMVIDTKKHPALLKDEVTSPSGTTIEAIKVLESNNFRGTLIETVRVCTEKSKKMTK